MSVADSTVGTVVAEAGPLRWWQDRGVVWAIGLTLGLLALRLLVIGRFGLFFDEAYYWLWSTALAPGYYDHPPMVAYFVRFGTLLFGNNEFGIRFAGAVSLAIDAALVFAIARTLFGDRGVAAWAAIFANFTIIALVSVISVPDQPMILFWLAAMLGLARIARGGRPAWWILAGVMFGLSAASKYTAFFLLAGVPLWLILVPQLRRWLIRPWPYLGILTGIAVFSPVLIWNATHGWASFVLQYGRPTYEVADYTSFLLYLLLIPLVVTPPIFVLATVGALRGLRARPLDPGLLLLLIVPIPLALYFAWHSLGEEIGFHWLSPFALIAALMAARVLGQDRGRTVRSLRLLARGSIVFGLAATLVAYFFLAQNRFAVPFLDDPTARFRGWPEFVQSLEDLRVSVGAAYIVGDQYYHPAYVRFYLDDPPPVFHIGEWSRWSGFPAADPALADQPALFIGKWGRDHEQAIAERYFTNVEFLGNVPRPVGHGRLFGERAFLVSGPRPEAMALFNNWIPPDP